MFFDGSVRSTRSSRWSRRVLSSASRCSATGADAARASKSSVSIEMGYARATTVRSPTVTLVVPRSTGSPSSSWQPSTKLRAERLVWNATTSLPSMPVKIASRIDGGSTRQASEEGQGMCTKWWRNTSGHRERTSSGRR